MSCFRIFFNNTLPNFYVCSFRIGFPIILFIFYKNLKKPFLFRI